MKLALIYMQDDVSTLGDHVNYRLSQILDWCRYNKLSLNQTKTESMLVTNRHYTISPSIWLDSNELILKTCVKYLGLSIDDSFKFQSLAENIKSRLSHYIGFGYKLNFPLNLTAAMIYYYSRAYSTVIYCVSVRGGPLQASCRRKNSLCFVRG